MIQFRQLTLTRGVRRLIEAASLQIHAGWRVGVVGANGSGKSSLFALLRGDIQSEAGDCLVPRDWRVASVAQETPPLPQAAIEFVLDGDEELRRVERAIAAADAAHDGRALAELHARLEAIDGYSARARAAALLAGLGFATADLARPVADFSGGWRMRLNLAQALVSRADLMLLDEPTNHLDLDAVVWLERWLANYRGTLLLVSHDRDFLDGTVTHVVHLERGMLMLYTGNYTAFETQRAARLAVQQAMFEKQQREIAHMTSFVERFRAKASKARQAQSRLKALDRLEHIAAAHVDSSFDFEFPEPRRAPDPLLTLEDAALGYGNHAVVCNLQLSLRPGTRLGLLGPNGAGKSTLIKSLAGGQPLLAGRRVEGYGLETGYFAQHQVEQLRGDESPLHHLLRQDPGAREQDLRNFLGGFDFRGEMADAPVEPFSGGEKSRLALALLVRKRPNLLLLDEPTNHLDLEMRHALTRALAGYDGSLVLVSHDRALLRTVCDSFMLVADGRAVPFDGDLEDYLVWLTARRESAPQDAAVAGSAGSKENRRTQRETAAAERQLKLVRRRPLLKESTQLEARMARLEPERKELEAKLADTAYYARTPSAEVQATSRRCAEVIAELGDVEERWLEVHAELEVIGDA
ncbi:MAG: ATP-binding cassette domain-containing protein [Steroidobacteraceae bacterium]|nr:ATP-binding cassette domain-containing protein [Steroidobacteraceae bacterium]MBP7015537.1 ATP-binding cassette domain-containing protein [Steroidobacteraceae bacterium]